MKKHITKFIAAFVLIVVAATMVMMGTYAWFVLSTNPTAGGMEVTVGSSEDVTILIAPDITATDEENNTYHVPGAFSKTLSFSEAGYGLDSLAGLAPVSTADGVNWYGPVYASIAEGGGLIGYKMLAGADLTTLEGETYAPLYDLTGAPVNAEKAVSAVNIAQGGDTSAGSYICLDFWVVSPNEEYTLRVATKVTDGNEPDAFDAGSFVLELPRYDKTADAASVTRSSAEACVRVGFLVDETALGDGALTAYRASDGANTAFKALRGAYADGETSFTIYEPNAGLHPDGAAEDGIYSVTTPWGAGGDPVSIPRLGVSVNGIHTADVSGRLTVQGNSSWAVDPTDTSRTNIEKRLEQPTDDGERSAEDRVSYVIGTSLSGQLAKYVLSGGFERDASALTDGAPLTAKAGAADNAAIVRLTENEPQRIRMFIWLEGQDVDCAGSTQGGQLIINIELAGASDVPDG